MIMLKRVKSSSKRTEIKLDSPAWSYKIVWGQGEKGWQELLKLGYMNSLHYSICECWTLPMTKSKPCRT